MGLVIADTNIVIYILKGLSPVKPYLIYDFALSDITVIELLGVKDIETQTLKIRQEFINSAYIYPLNYNIRQLAISLKQKYTLKTPDAIIAATALDYNQPLLTADKDFKKIKELPAIIISL